MRFDDIELAKTQVSDSAPGLVKISLAIDDFEIRRLHCLEATLPAAKTLVIDSNKDLDMTLDGESHAIHAGVGFVLANRHIGELRLHSPQQ